MLVATDVASKGLDFEEIQHVINYDMPDDVENYGLCLDSVFYFNKTVTLHYLSIIFVYIYVSIETSTPKSMQQQSRLFLRPTTFSNIFSVLSFIYFLGFL